MHVGHLGCAHGGRRSVGTLDGGIPAHTAWACRILQDSFAAPVQVELNFPIVTAAIIEFQHPFEGFSLAPGWFSQPQMN